MDLVGFYQIWRNWFSGWFSRTAVVGASSCQVGELSRLSTSFREMVRLVNRSWLWIRICFLHPFLLATGRSVVGAGGRSPIVGSVWTRVFIDRPEDGGRDRGLPSREPNTCGALRNIHRGKNCYDDLCSCYVESSRNLHRTNIYCQTIEIDLTRLLVLWE